MKHPRFAAVVLGVLWLAAPRTAQACRGDDQMGTLVGWVVDARTYEHGEEDFSKEEDERLHKIAEFGPLLAFIEEGTSRVRPFYGFPSEEPVGKIPGQHARYIGHRVSVTGCVSESGWPSVYDVADIQILDGNRSAR